MKNIHNCLLLNLQIWKYETDQIWQRIVSVIENLCLFYIIGSDKKPAEGASSCRCIGNQLLVHVLGCLVLDGPGPVAFLVVLLGKSFKRWEVAMLRFTDSLSLKVREVVSNMRTSLPIFWENMVVLFGSNVLEEELVVACFARVEFGLELDCSDLDSLAFLTVEIFQALRCRPSVDV